MKYLYIFVLLLIISVCAIFKRAEHYESALSLKVKDPLCTPQECIPQPCTLPTSQDLLDLLSKYNTMNKKVNYLTQQEITLQENINYSQSNYDQIKEKLITENINIDRLESINKKSIIDQETLQAQIINANDRANECMNTLQKTQALTQVQALAQQAQIEAKTQAQSITQTQMEQAQIPLQITK